MAFSLLGPTFWTSITSNLNQMSTPKICINAVCCLSKITCSCEWQHCTPRWNSHIWWRNYCPKKIVLTLLRPAQLSQATPQHQAQVDPGLWHPLSPRFPKLWIRFRKRSVLLLTQRSCMQQLPSSDSLQPLSVTINLVHCTNKGVTGSNHNHFLSQYIFPPAEDRTFLTEACLVSSLDEEEEVLK